jgi:type IV secretion system protein VirD4
MTDQEQGFIILLLSILFMGVMAKKRRQPSDTFGTAHWMTEQMMQALGMFGRQGLVIGRALKSRNLIRVPRFVHALICGATGAGKGIGLIIPNLLAQRCSVVCFDPKGENRKATAHRRPGRKIVLAPYEYGADRLNPMDTLKNDRFLVDNAKAMANAIVVRTGMEHDTHWNDRSEQVITACIVFIATEMTADERNLNNVYRICSDVNSLLRMCDIMSKKGGLSAQMAGQIMMLFESVRAQEGVARAVTKEGASVISTALRHLGFLCSEAVAASVSCSTFKVEDLVNKQVTLYMEIPPHLLAASVGLLRLWVSTFITVLSQLGSERKEVMFLLDEAEALNGLNALEATLVRGRSAGIRLVLAYQSDSQIKAAFAQKPTLLYDNCALQLYLGASGIETAKRISESLGTYTQTLTTYQNGQNRSRNWNDNGGQGGGNYGTNSGYSYSENGRALLMPDEVMTLDESLLICFLRGKPPVLARRIEWFRDPLFARR